MSDTHPHRRATVVTTDGEAAAPNRPQSTDMTSAHTSNQVSSTTATLTLTEHADEHEEILTLTLRSRPQVRWDESVIDNEGIGRKSSKRCCIFHKQRAFGESSTDSSDYDSDRSGSSTASAGSNGDKKPRANKKGPKIARPKEGNKVPDFQRFHA